MWKDAKWLRVPKSEIRRCDILQGDMNGRFAYYRLALKVRKAKKAMINITANSRYRLWVNEKPVLSGPCKGDRYRQYFKQIDIAGYLQEGKNVIAVQVLFCDPNAVAHQYSEHAPLFSVASLPVGHPFLYEKEHSFCQTDHLEILRRTLDNPSVLQCSFSTGYGLFRAFERVDDYGSTRTLMNKWIDLIDLECTTCPEEPEMGRSECHAWSVLPLYYMN